MKVETYKIFGWKEKETGLLIDENDDWILVKHIPVDYVIDGYKLYNKKYLKNRKSKAKEEKIARVLRLKNTPTNAPDTFRFGSILETLSWCEQKYGLFEFQDNETEIFYGTLELIEQDMFSIDMIKSNGKIEKEFDYEFSVDEISVITFESDYFESMCLLFKDEKTKKTKNNPLNIVE